MTDENPVLEIHYPDGRVIRAFASGKCEGVDGDCIIVNRAPLLIAQGVTRVVQELVDAQAMASFPGVWTAKK